MAQPRKNIIRRFPPLKVTRTWANEGVKVELQSSIKRDSIANTGFSKTDSINGKYHEKYQKSSV